MTSKGEGLTGSENEVVSPLNPLQLSHNHLYATKPAKPNRFSFVEGEVTEKPKKRASRHVNPTAEPARSSSVTMKRRASRLGMFGLFTRAKNPEFQVAELAMPLEEETTSEKEATTEPIRSVTDAPLDPQYDSDSDPASKSLRRRASKKALKTKESFIRPKPKSWEPPPLFQAYPQSLKHATLSTPTMPAESLIRLNHDRQQKSADQNKSGDNNEMTKKQREKKLRKSQAFELANSRDWSPKVFALVTEGYLLQYAGQGSHDRLPEKILPLCKQSAAFATDVIRGKPFVLQISQTTGEDGLVDTDVSKELLKRANLKSEIKRTASAFLLVLGSPEEMNEWLVAVRKEIENNGGKEYKPEVFGTDGMRGHKASLERKKSQSLQRVPSQRYLVKRDPYQFSPKMPDSPSLPSYEEKVPEPSGTQSSKGLGLSTTNRYSLATSDSTYSRTTGSIDQAQLDQLRETPRQSYMSGDAKTASTSRCSSMDRSPVLGRQAISNDQNVPEQLRQSQSLQRGEKTPQPLRIADRASPISQAISGVSTLSAPLASPSTPNFSVPTFSKRFSATPGSLASRSASHGSHNLATVADQEPVKAPIEKRPDSASSQGKAFQKPDSRPSSQKAWHAEPHSRPQSAGSETRYAKRNSSLNYARGISPVALPRHSPSPHPPPTIALPPLPIAAGRPSIGVPPPTVPPPPPPVQAPTVPAPIAPTPIAPTPIAAVPIVSAPIAPVPAAPFPAATAPIEPARFPTPASAPVTQAPLMQVVELANNPESKAALPVVTAIPKSADKPRKLRRPISMQVRRRPPTPPNSQHAVQVKGNSTRPATQGKSVNSLMSGSESRRVALQPPSAPPPSPKLPSRKLADNNPGSHLTQGLTESPINNSSTDALSESPEPHAYIPPIRLSNRKSGLSLDGPWNNASFAFT